MLTAAKTVLVRLLSNPEVQAMLFLVAVDLTLNGSAKVYDKVMDKAAQHVAAEIKRKEAQLVQENRHV